MCCRGRCYPSFDIQNIPLNLHNYFIMKKILVITGPTATGKTDLALRLSAGRRIAQGELVACDSRQVYRGLDIGTGKRPGMSAQMTVYSGQWKIDGIPIHMYDVADPKEQYTVKDYVDKAQVVIDDIVSRGKLPIIVGGTGLYLKALLFGLPNLEIPISKKLREELENLNLQVLQDRLRKLNPKRWEEMNNSDRQNKHRLLRSIELIYMYPYRKVSGQTTVYSKQFDVLMIGLTAPRQVLNTRIDQRLVSRIDQGMVEEAKRLYGRGLSLERMKKLGLEYGVLAEYLEGKLTKDQMVEKLKTKIHRYAKRQMIYFKKYINAQWFDITQQKWQEKVEELVSFWYHSHNDKKD